MLNDLDLDKLEEIERMRREQADGANGGAGGAGHHGDGAGDVINAVGASLNLNGGRQFKFTGEWNKWKEFWLVLVYVLNIKNTFVTRI